MGSATPIRGTRSRVSKGGATSSPAPASSAANRELDAAWRRVRDLEHQNAALEDQALHLRADRDEKAAALAAVIGSTAWRMTAPIRGLMAMLRGTTVSKAAAGPAAPPPPLAVGPPPEAQPEARRRAQDLPPLQPLTFPLAGQLAAPAELTGTPPAPLEVTVSVVIPTLNAGPEFHWLLRKLKAQKGLGDVEIVVVDSGSDDGTAELAQGLGCTLVRLARQDFTHSHARNLGADAARGELLLFTVQDAYPVGDWWLHSLAAALTRPRTEDQRVSALSCSEFSRRDGELVYNLGIDVHYRFLGCRDTDRIGVLTGDDQLSLRTQGQLSDVACMIPAAIFQAYRYYGRYAEDLVLGVRMIRDGHRLALLSSAQVIHSHNRPAAYHLKRAFVDVVFLAEAFPDFSFPEADAVSGAMAAGAQLRAMLREWRPRLGAPAAEDLRAFAEQARTLPLHDLKIPVGLDFGLPPLAPWIAEAAAADGVITRLDAEAFARMFAAKLGVLADHVERVYGHCDEHLARELSTAARKLLASCVGAQLAFVYLRLARAAEGAPPARMRALHDLMLAGV